MPKGVYRKNLSFCDGGSATIRPDEIDEGESERTAHKPIFV